MIGVLILGSGVSAYLLHRQRLRLVNLVTERHLVPLLYKKFVRALLARQLVPGDVIVVQKGRAACDMVLLRGACLVEESMLSGEVGDACTGLAACTQCMLSAPPSVPPSGALSCCMYTMHVISTTIRGFVLLPVHNACHQYHHQGLCLAACTQCTSSVPTSGALSCCLYPMHVMSTTTRGFVLLPVHNACHWHHCPGQHTNKGCLLMVRCHLLQVLGQSGVLPGFCSNQCQKV